MLEEHSFPYAYTSCIRDPNSVAAVVLPGVPNVETSLSMGFVRLSVGGSDMHLYCRAEGREKICIVIMLAIQACKRGDVRCHP